MPYNDKMDILEQLEKIIGQTISPDRAELDTLGLNHLSWHRGFTLDGEDIWPKIIQEYVKQLRSSDDPEFDPSIIETLRMIPNYYLGYYYDSVHKIELQKQWPPSRAEEVMEVEKNLLIQYADETLDEIPADLMKRGGAYYSTVATQLIDSHYNDLGEMHVVNTRNDGAVKEWPKEWVLEMPCKINRSGIHPQPTKPLTPVCASLIYQVKTYELLTAEAAVTGNRNSAFQALLAHPLGPRGNQIQVVLEDMLEANHKYLPQFRKNI